MKNKLTEGNITSSLVKFSIPMIVGNIFQQMYNVADTLIVGRTLGPQALSAVGSSFTLMTLITSIIIGFCLGSSVVFARFYGARDYERLKISIFNGFFFILIIAIIINLISYLLLNNIIVWIKIPPQAVDMTRQYLSRILIGIIFVYIYNFASALLRAMGNTLVPLIFLIIAALTNIILDIVFITQFHMGVKGAAWATVVSQALSATLVLGYFLLRARHLLPSRIHWKFNKSILNLIANNSILTAIQQSIMNLGILMVQGLINSFGLAVSAAYAAASKVEMISYMPSQEIGNALSTFVAQNFGARKKDRIFEGLKVALILSLALSIISSIAIYIFAGDFMEIFIAGGEGEIVNIGIVYLRTVGMFYTGIAILFIWYGYFRGLSQARISVLLTITSLGLRVLLAHVLTTTRLGIMGVWISIPLGWYIADLIGLVFYRITRKSRDIIDFL